MLSPGSMLADRTLQPVEYGAAAIPHFWLVELCPELSPAAHAPPGGTRRRRRIGSRRPIRSGRPGKPWHGRRDRRHPPRHGDAAAAASPAAPAARAIPATRATPSDTGRGNAPPGARNALNSSDTRERDHSRAFADTEVGT